MNAPDRWLRDGSATSWQPPIAQLIEDNPNARQRYRMRGNHLVRHSVYSNRNEEKIEVKEDTRVPSTTIFTFNKEDHTLGNLISQRLHKYPYILFSAYKVPHPLFAMFELRVTTDGSITPREAVTKCCADVVRDLDVLQQSFTTEWLGKRIVTEGEAERQARDQNPN
ncbi:DNA-directed RNA polymerase [Massariosphaeria phaeospora]|uniref:DNA-directed RNA polymerase n=1 Tax=Massariosphaeria phaeospora TaxID=100035 RepID=A0A7C8MFD8_9PLEO|nr:DNA-directed RNA polymerase [Massariosphaeria phaeospora]